MKNILFLFLLFTSNFHNAFAVGLKSYYHKTVSFNLENGIVFSNNNKKSQVVILNQLKYLFGTLNEINAGVDFPKLKVNLNKVEDADGVFEISYSVSGKLVLPKKYHDEYLELLLPKFGDEKGLTEFLNKYKGTCSRKTYNSLETFWNYYRPHNSPCPLKNASDREDTVLLKLKVLDNSFDEEREVPYEKIFEDNKLEATIVVTKDNPQSMNDFGFEDFKSLCRKFILPPNEVQETKNECHFEVQTVFGLFVGHIFLTPNFNEGTSDFMKKITPYIKQSDYISYNGHSGMGINVNTWEQEFPLSENKYQLFYLNSCDTYGYFSGHLFERVHKFNEANLSDTAVDVLLNANPNYFGTFADTNIVLLKQLQQRAGLDAILQSLPEYQAPVIFFDDSLESIR